MIRTDKLYVSGGCIGIKSADGALHTSLDTGNQRKTKKKVDDHYIDPDEAKVCLCCEKTDCTGDIDCYIMARNRKNGIGEDKLYREFMDQYNKMIGDGLTLTDVAKKLEVNKSTLWRSMRRQHFGGMTAERIKIFLKKDEIDYGK